MRRITRALQGALDRETADGVTQLGQRTNGFGEDSGDFGFHLAGGLERAAILPGYASSRSTLEKLHRVDIDGPAGLAARGFGFQHRSQVGKHFVQRAAVGAL